MAAPNPPSNSDVDSRSGDPLSTSDEELIRYLQESSHVDARSPSVVSIFRVPGRLMEVSKNTGAYVPKRVSLGPYHHGTSAGLAAIEHHKPRALRRMIERFNIANQAGPINMDFSVKTRMAIGKVQEVQEVIKNNYYGNVDCNGKKLDRMLTLDGCFILEIMRLLVTEMPPSEGYDPLFEKYWLLHVERDLLADILKLENQIPLIVLRKLLELELNEGDVTVKLSQIVLRFLLTFYPFDNDGNIAFVRDHRLLSIFQNRLLQNSQGHHLLQFFRTLVVFAPFGEDAGCILLSDGWDDDAVDLERKRKSLSCGRSLCRCFCQLPCWLYTLIVSRFSHNGGKYNVVADIPRAVDLANAGIKFKQCPGGIKNIYFEPNSATMYLPSIIVNDWTELAFLNLMAFELQKRFKTNYVVNYMYLMKKLMVSEADVLLLKREGVVSNYRGTDKEVAKLFNNISQGIVIKSEGFMGGLAQEVMVYRYNKCNSYRAALLNDYFSTPWKTLGVVAATLLLALTIMQTIFTILAFYKS